MDDTHYSPRPPMLLRLQSWLSPAFPTGSYSYSHGLEWAVEAGHVNNSESLVDWLEADLCYGSGRNEAIFFNEAWRCTRDDDRARLFEIAELAAAFRGTSEFALESSQQASACNSMLRRVWPDRLLDALSQWLSGRHVPPALSVVLGVRSAREGIQVGLAFARLSAKLSRQFGDHRSASNSAGSNGRATCDRGTRRSGTRHQRSSQKCDD